MEMPRTGANMSEKADGVMDEHQAHSRVYSLRLPESIIDEIRELAERRGQAPTSMLRDWVLERLSAERKHQTGPASLVQMESTEIEAAE